MFKSCERVSQLFSVTISRPIQGMSRELRSTITKGTRFHCRNKMTVLYDEPDDTLTDMQRQLLRPHALYRLSDPHRPRVLPGGGGDVYGRSLPPAEKGVERVQTRGDNEESKTPPSPQHNHDRGGRCLHGFPPVRCRRMSERYCAMWSRSSGWTAKDYRWSTNPIPVLLPYADPAKVRFYAYSTPTDSWLWRSSSKNTGRCVQTTYTRTEKRSGRPCFFSMLSWVVTRRASFEP